MSVRPSSAQACATAGEIEAMRAQLRASLAQGALGLSSGLAYGSAFHAPSAEVAELASEDVVSEPEVK